MTSNTEEIIEREVKRITEQYRGTGLDLKCLLEVRLGQFAVDKAYELGLIRS